MSLAHQKEYFELVQMQHFHVTQHFRSVNCSSEDALIGRRV